MPMGDEIKELLHEGNGRILESCNISPENTYSNIQKWQNHLHFGVLHRWTGITRIMHAYHLNYRPPLVPVYALLLLLCFSMAYLLVHLHWTRPQWFEQLHPQALPPSAASLFNCICTVISLCCEILLINVLSYQWFYSHNNKQDMMVLFTFLPTS